MSDLVIKISGDVKNFEDALERAQKRTEDLGDGLEKIAKVSAVAFAVLTAEIGLSVHAYGESEKASNLLTQSLIAQGIYSKTLVESYEKQAKSISDLTGVSDEAIMSAQTTIQGLIGQKKVTQELTQTIVDLAAAKQMDMNSTAELIGKAINGQTMALKKLGIEIEENMSKQQRQAAIIEQVTLKYGGMAEAATKGLGVFKLVDQQFDNLQEEIGKKFAPMVEYAGKQLEKFIKYLQDPAVTKFIADLLVFGVVATGLATAVASLGVAFLGLTALLGAAGIAFGAIALPVGIAVAAITLLAGTAVYLFENWANVLPQAQAIFAGFVSSITTLADGLGTILMGAFKLDLDLIKRGWDEVQDALTNGMDTYNLVLKEKLKEAAKIEGDAEAEKIERNKNAADAHAASLAAQREKEFQDFLASNEEYQALEVGQKEAFRDINREMFIKEHLNEKTELQKAATEKLTTQLKTNNQFLADKRKYNAAYAEINKAMHSEEYQGAALAFGNLAQLQQSHNSTMKAIGKVAAVANIIISTNQAAIDVFRGFVAMAPGPIGMALGIAGAAATVAFGMEKVAAVTAAADGGLMEGGIPGRDSIPTLTMPGELVVPRSNFEEVVGAVRNSRGGEDGGGGGSIELVMSLKDNLMDFIDLKTVERRRMNVSLQRA